MNILFDIATQIETFFWGYIGFFLILLLGIYFTLYSRFFQLKAIYAMYWTFKRAFEKKRTESIGIHPIKAFFASVGGMVGIGNMVGIVVAIQIGGPGALFWSWIAAIFGSLIKYSEVYLGLKYRIANKEGGYDGGPMFFLKKAFSWKFVPGLVCLLLCIYGVEIYQFNIIVSSVSENWNLSPYLVTGIMLAAVLYAGLGGIGRVGKICSSLLPFFVGIYILMGLWVLIEHASLLPAILKQVFSCAFTGHAPLGGFAGSTIMLAVKHGTSKAAYSSDVGIGYDSIIHSESRAAHPEMQARLATYGVFLDNVICTISMLLVLVTGIWHVEPMIPASKMVQTALSASFPMMHIFVPIMLFILGYTTIIAYFSVGLKCARYLFKRKGVIAYYLYAIIVLPLFTFVDETQAILVMQLAGGMLLCLNLWGIYRLRSDVAFRHEKELDNSL